MATPKEIQTVDSSTSPERHSNQPIQKTSPSEVGPLSSQLIQPMLMSFTEVKGDLFSCPATASMAHCVSEDLHMGKGIATLFKRQFGRVGELKTQGARPGGVAVISVQKRFIYYLVTKTRYFHKPTYESLSSSLQAMKEHMITHNVDELCMPKLGCGLDRLAWDKVSRIICELFQSVPVRITVYYL